MSIACDGRNQEVVTIRGGRVVGRLPFVASKRAFGLTTLGMPPMTHVLGPALAPEVSVGNIVHPMKQIFVIHDLISQLPNAPHISFRLYNAFSNTLAFDTAGFVSGVDYTVEIKPAAVETMWREMRDKTRNVIRRARERLVTTERCGPGEFVDFYVQNLKARGRTDHYDRVISERIITECLRRGAGRILAATSVGGDLHAAIFTVWDNIAEYYFLSTRRVSSLNGATSLLIWTAMQHAAERGLTFDMDGLHVQQTSIPNMLLLSGFGGSIKPRYVVRRSSPMFRVMRSAKRLIQPIF